VIDEGGSRVLGEHDRRRLRTARWLVVGGAALGVVGAAALGIAGASGGLGLVAVLLGIMVGCVLTAAHLAAFALVDEIRHRPVATRRPIEALGFFLTALLLMLLVMGAAGAATGTVDDDDVASAGDGR
jgi:amino acid transporter